MKKFRWPQLAEASQSAARNYYYRSKQWEESAEIAHSSVLATWDTILSLMGLSDIRIEASITLSENDYVHITAKSSTKGIHEYFLEQEYPDEYEWFKYDLIDAIQSGAIATNLMDKIEQRLLQHLQQARREEFSDLHVLPVLRGHWWTFNADGTPTKETRKDMGL